MKNLLIIRGTQATINRCETVIRSDIDHSKLKDTQGVLVIVQDKTERTVTENTQCIILSWALVHKLTKKADKQFIKVEWYENDMEGFLSDELPDGVIKQIETGPAGFWEFDDQVEDYKHFSTEIAGADGTIEEMFEPPVVPNMLVITRPLELIEKVNYPDIKLPEGELHKLRQTYGVLLLSKKPNTRIDVWSMFHIAEVAVRAEAPASISFCQSDKESCRLDILPDDFFTQAAASKGDSFFYSMPEALPSMRDYGTAFEGEAEVIPQDQSPLYTYSVEALLEHLSDRLNAKITITR